MFSKGERAYGLLFCWKGNDGFRGDGCIIAWSFLSASSITCRLIFMPYTIVHIEWQNIVYLQSGNTKTIYFTWQNFWMSFIACGRVYWVTMSGSHLQKWNCTLCQNSVQISKLMMVHSHACTPRECEKFYYSYNEPLEAGGSGLKMAWGKHWKGDQQFLWWFGLGTGILSCTAWNFCPNKVQKEKSNLSFQFSQLWGKRWRKVEL